MTLRCLQGMLTIEAFINKGEDDKHLLPKLTLTQGEIKRLNSQISEELQSIVPHMADSSFTIVGGLYQSSEILQPGFPIHTQLRQYTNATLKGENNKRNQLIIGASNGKLPESLRQNSKVEKTPLFLMPFVILTDNEESKTVFEQQLMHKGMGSKQLLMQLQDALDIKIRHVNFMTVLDLAAMMHNHLQMAGFEPLWQLLEQAIFNKNPEAKAKTIQFNEFYLSKKIVFTPFFTYSHWLQSGPAKDIEENTEILQEKYLHYIQVQRQFVATLLEHGLDVRQFFPAKEVWPVNQNHICFATLSQYWIRGDYYHQVIKPLSTKKTTADKNEHSQLGLLFYQLTDDSDGLEFYYPLNASGIEQIESILKLNQ